MTLHGFGRELGQFGANKVVFIGQVVCFAVFWAAGAFCLTLMGTPTSRLEAGDRFYFDMSGWGMSPKQLFLPLAGGLFLLGLACLFLALAQRAKCAFILFEKGIVARSGGKGIGLLFSEIADVYLFSAGRTGYGGVLNCLAYRRDRNSEWFIVSPKNARYDELIRQFRTLYAKEKEKTLLTELERGKVVEFQYVDGKTVWWKQAFSLRLADFVQIDSSLKELRLGRNGVEISGQHIAIGGADAVDATSWIENVHLAGKDGKRRFSLVLPSILSMDVFMRLLEHVIEKPA